jgi:uncharacterized protein YeaO (DUF488 family)
MPLDWLESRGGETMAMQWRRILADLASPVSGLGIMAFVLRVRRIYEPPGTEDGHRVLVDRLWPRGVKKAEAAIDEWARDVAPSADLRRWYGHQPDRFEEFARRYRAELAAAPAAGAVADLVARLRQGPVTLLTATRDVERSGAAVLAEHLASILRHTDRSIGR